MKRAIAFSAAAVLLANCAPEVPDSGARGVGFSDYSSYEAQRAARDAQLTGRPAPQAAGAPGSATAPVTTPVFDPVLTPESQGVQTAGTPTTGNGAISADELAQAGIGAPAQTVASVSEPGAGSVGVPQQTVAGVQPTTPTETNNDGISDEQDFSAVTARESIESDAARREQQAAQYQVVAPTAVPERTSNGGPNIVQYALQTTNNPGEALYSRLGFNAERRYERNCGQYASADIAQQDFLVRGGPISDRQGLDPDGDGFACGWDPRPFRAARGG